MNKNFWVRTESNRYSSVLEARVFWTIENFMDWKDEEIGQSILSPSFRVKHTSGSKETKWQIELFPKGHITDALAGTDGQRLPRVSVFLRGISDLRKDHVAVSVSIVDSHLNRIHEEKLQHQPNTEKLSEDENMCYGDGIGFLSWDDLVMCESDVIMPAWKRVDS